MTDRHARLLAFGMGGLFASYFGLYVAAMVSRTGPARFGDFFALWADGRLLHTDAPKELYDSATLFARQIALGMPPDGSTPFAYPPSFLSVLWPLGLLSYTAAYAAFMGTTFCLYVLAVVLPRPHLALALIAIVAPTSILTLAAGQSGFLAAALFLGGMRLATAHPARPVLGGVLIGLLAYKPQLGLLVPVALAAAGQWRCIGAALATVFLVALASSAAFGWHIWADWLAAMPAFSAQFARESTEILYLMPTLTAALRMVGAAPSLVGPMQAALALAAAVWVWRACRRGSAPRALLVLVIGTFLAAPYAFVYDLPLLTGAVLLFIDHRLRAEQGFSTGEVAALALALIFPAIMVHAGKALTVGAPCLVVLAAMLIAQPSKVAPA
jgi:hypothetical protein